MPHLKPNSANQMSHITSMQLPEATFDCGMVPKESLCNLPQVTFKFALPLQRNCCAGQSALSQLVGQAAFLQATVTLQRGAWVPPPMVLSTGAPVYIHTGVASTTSLLVDVRGRQPVSFGSVSAQSSLNLA